MGFAFSDGSRLKKFKDEIVDDKSFHQQKLTGKVDDAGFKQMRVKSVTSILATLDKRFSDVNESFISSTHIASFKSWPVHEKKEEIQGY